MKKMMLTVLISTLGLNIIIPWLYYQIFGFFYVTGEVSIAYVNRATILISVCLLLAIAVIYFAKETTQPETQRRTHRDDLFDDIYVDALFGVSVILNVIKSIAYGGFSGLLAGNADGKLISYVILFLDYNVLFFLCLYKAYKYQSFKRFVIYSGAYLLISLCYSSRSGLFWIVLLNLFLFFSMDLSKAFRKKLLLCCGAMVLVAPILYIVSTIKRYGASSDYDVWYYIRQIIGRLSYVEVGGIQLERYQNGTMGMDVFVRKYSLDNQLMQIVNSAVLGDIFPADISPNLYWRNIFGAASIEECQTVYCSIYSIFPVYLCLKYGYVLGIPIFVGFVYLYYRLMSKITWKPIAGFLVCYIFYVIVEYFDWVYHFQDVLRLAMTIGAYFAVRYLYPKAYKYGARILEKINARRTQ